MLNPYGTYANSTDPNQTPHNAGYPFTIAYILGNPGVMHSVPTAFGDECSGYVIDHPWISEDGLLAECYF